MRAALALAIACCLFAAGWTVEGWRKDAQIASMKAQFALDQKTLSNAATQASEAAREKERTWQAQLAAADQRHAEELARANQETNRLRAAVDASAVQLRVRAVCSADTSHLPGAAPAAGVDDGTTVELAPSARSAYFDLKAGIERDQQIIRGMQSYIRALQSAP
jgi:prophage endopeptidase